MIRYVFIYFFSLVSVLNAQEKNKIVTDDKSGKSMLVGYGDRQAFQDSNFAWWFNSEYSNYDVDTNALAIDFNQINDLNITIVMGTWCSDSRREVPRFYKILDLLGYSEERIILINVDRSLNSPERGVENLNINFVPTMVFYKGEEEIGRIIESPEETLEKDFTKIVNDEQIDPKQ